MLRDRSGHRATMTKCRNQIRLIAGFSHPSFRAKRSALVFT